MRRVRRGRSKNRACRANRSNRRNNAVCRERRCEGTKRERNVAEDSPIKRTGRDGRTWAAILLDSFLVMPREDDPGLSGGVAATVHSLKAVLQKPAKQNAPAERDGQQSGDP